VLVSIVIGAAGGLRRGGPAVVAALLTVVMIVPTQHHLGSRPVGIAYTKNVWARRPRHVTDDCHQLLRGALAHHGPWSPIDD
jgi:hypothetical protein